MCIHFNFWLFFQIGAEREFFFDGKPVKKPKVDLIIAYFPDGLPVPGVFNPPSQIPKWNAHVEGFLKYMISFCGGYLHDDGAFLLFYPDNPQVRRELFSFFNKNKLKMKDAWTIVNSLHLSNPVNPSKFVSRLACYVFVYFPYSLFVASIPPTF